MRFILGIVAALWIFLEICLLVMRQNLILVSMFSIFGIFLGAACGYLATKEGIRARNHRKD